MDTLPICKAKSKQSGKRCRNFAVKHRFVCHIHGGKTPLHNPGPKTKEGEIKQKTGGWCHGQRSREAEKERKAFRKMVDDYKRSLENLCKVL